MPRYPLSKHLIQKAFELICAHKSINMGSLRMDYVYRLFVTDSQVRSWQSGAAKPNELAEIEAIARDAIKIARLDEEWLRAFLRETNAPQPLWQILISELKQREPVRLLQRDGRQPFEIPFPTGNFARVIGTQAFDEIAQDVQSIGLNFERPTLLLIGGADGVDDDYAQRLRPFFEQTLVPLCERLQITVIDGGTNAGVMRLMGIARAKAKATFSLVGVAAKGTVQLPDTERAVARLMPVEPNHSHFILVPGTKWSNESKWMVAIANQLAMGRPSLTLLVNGGEVTWEDVAHSMFAGRPVLAVDGSGRAADAFCAALRGEGHSERAALFAKAGVARSVDVEDNSRFVRLVEYFMLEGKWYDE